MTTIKDLYKILDLSEHATFEEVKSSYRKKALLLHPDKGGDPEQFKNLNLAYETLKRKNENPNNTIGQVVENFIKHFIYEKQKCQPIIYKHKVSIEDICSRKIIKLKLSLLKICQCTTTNYKICEKCLGNGYIYNMKNFGIFIQKIQEQCKICDSEGKNYIGCEKCKNGIYLEDKIFELYLNPEISDGYNYIFKNQGNQEKGKNQGDFVVILEYLQHNMFSIENKDLIIRKNISLKEALCGYMFSLQHPSGEMVNISSTSITKPFMFLKISGKGISQEGNLIINFNIIFPDILDSEKIDLLKSIL